MRFNNHIRIYRIDRKEPEYNEYNILFKLFPNLSVERKKEYGIENYILVRLEWLFWSFTIYYKSKLNKNYE